MEGGAEFGGAMREPDLKAIELAGGWDVPIRIIPTAAAPDHNDQRAGKNGIRWFEHLGARDVKSIPLIDRDSANDERIARSLQDARLIYILGGFTHYLGQTLKGSRAWQAVLEAYQQGAVVAGSSAGAMVMCERYYDPEPGTDPSRPGPGSQLPGPASSRYIWKELGAASHVHDPGCHPDRHRRADRHAQRRRRSMDRLRKGVCDPLYRRRENHDQP